MSGAFHKYAKLGEYSRFYDALLAIPPGVGAAMVAHPGRRMHHALRSTSMGLVGATAGATAGSVFPSAIDPVGSAAASWTLSQANAIASARREKVALQEFRKFLLEEAAQQARKAKLRKAGKVGLGLGLGGLGLYGIKQLMES